MIYSTLTTARLPYNKTKLPKIVPAGTMTSNASNRQFLRK